MSRNRKNEKNVLRFGPALRVLGLCLFLGGSGVGYVWQKDQINSLGDKIKQREAKYDRLRRQNDLLFRVLAMLQSPVNVEAQIKQLDLGLVAPQADQIVHLIDGPISAESPVVGPDRLYAAQRHWPGASP